MRASALKLPLNLLAGFFAGVFLLTGASAQALTVQEAIDQYGIQARKKLLPFFRQAGVSYPPGSMTWIALKEEKVLLLFARNGEGKERQVKSYPILGTSGVAGPKLKEGDLQIPEGFYKITALEPNSVAHLALRINYPNQTDKANALKEGRANLGGDIEIHGSYWSTGCLAMGNDAIEELFVLAHDTGCKNLELILLPCNMMEKAPALNLEKQPQWLPDLYRQLKLSISAYPIKIDPQWLCDVYKDLARSLKDKHGAGIGADQ